MCIIVVNVWLSYCSVCVFLLEHVISSLLEFLLWLDSNYWPSFVFQAPAHNNNINMNTSQWHIGRWYEVGMVWWIMYNVNWSHKNPTSRHYITVLAVLVWTDCNRKLWFLISLLSNWMDWTKKLWPGDICVIIYLHKTWFGIWFININISIKYRKHNNWFKRCF